METLISIANLSFAYDKIEVFHDFFFSFEAGQRIGLVGSNGSGKSTLLQLIMGLLKPSAGEIELFGQARRTEKEFREARLQIGFVFQDANDQLFCPTVGDDLAFGPLNMGKTDQEAEQIVDETLALLNLTAFKDRVTYGLSDGEKKLVALGTALAMKPKMLILDEPTTCLDPEACQRIASVLLNCGLPYLVVAHDRAFLDQVVTSSVRLKDGRIVSEPKGLAGLARPLSALASELA
ncbi:MAG: energy-coupling factor ABC transporter ATP-binding protein [Deltaproteobacteria bacterium]|jgi:cobalt/nickel transport system ATP-binding protein|nr:energy-coupling factor ABC transporter ATP-binding protein [Deltaproteobacteria bacterium]